MDNDFQTAYKIEDSSSYNLIDRIKKSTFDEEKIIKVTYRPFSELYIYYDKVLLKRSFFSIFYSLVNKDNTGLIMQR